MKHERIMNCNNTSGIPGVSWSEEKQKWHSKIGFKYKRIHLGYFSDIARADHAYQKARKKYYSKKRSK